MIYLLVHLIALVLPAQCWVNLGGVGSVRGGALGSSYCHIYGRCIFTFTGLQFKLHPGLNSYLFKQSIKQFLNYHIYNQVLHHVGTRGVNSKMSTHPSIKLDVIFKDVDHPSVQHDVIFNPKLDL